jgi:diguanylate cyclase (GGDEF)-like protein/PAS domain S-box-containing protein
MKDSPLSTTKESIIYDSLFDEFQDSVIVIDGQQEIFYSNDVAKKFFLLHRIECKNSNIVDLFEQYEFSKDFKTYETKVKNSKTVVSIYQYPVKYLNIALEKIVVVKDITKYKLLEEVLYIERKRAQVTLQYINDAVIITDAKGVIDYMNAVAERFTGWSNAEAHGLPLAKVFNVIDELTCQPLPEPLEHCLREGHIITHASRSFLIQRDGQERAIEYTAVPVRNQDGWAKRTMEEIVGAVLVFRDVTALVGIARQMAYQASHDSLTGLINRRTFEAYLARVLGSAKTENTHHVLCYLDLDQFKIVNDTCGHIAGDHLLRQLTVPLNSRVRTTDILGRLGGDEFGVILQHCSIDQARQVAEDLRHAIKDFRFTWQEKTFELGVSIGLVPITADSGRPDEMLSAADAACYVAKAQGRNRIQVYRPDDTAVVQRHGEMQWVHRVIQALAEDRFCLYYQTIMPLATQNRGEIHGEILLRMVDEQGELVPPMAFIPAAEHYYLMPAIDRWVIRTALGVMVQTRQSASRPVAPRCFAINLSGQSLGDDEFLEFVTTQLQQNDVNAEQLCFEITETAAIANLSRAIHFMTTLRAIGCRFALDDFGSGLSSFAYLKQLPVDYLKIDGSFVREMLDDPIDCAMVNSINQIGHVMSIRTIAECVENDAILAKLQELGVDYAQGYGIAKPEPFVLDST